MYYTYYSYEEWGRGYIGYHRCHNKKSPETDGYYGSFKDKTFKPTQKVILDVYTTRTEALNAEIILHEYFKVDINTHFANKAKQTSTGFTCPEPWNKGKPWSDEIKSKISQANKGKEAWNAGKKGSQQGWNKGLDYRKNPMYLNETFTWINKKLDLLEEDFSVIDLNNKYSLHRSSLYAVKNKKKKHFKGWEILW